MEITLIGGPQDGVTVTISDTPAIVKVNAANMNEPGPTWCYRINRKTRTATYESSSEDEGAS